VVFNFMKQKQDAQNNEVFLTREGLEQLKQELKELTTAKQPDLIKRVARARDFGDLMENTEYSVAREELAFVEGRIAELEEVLAGAKVIAEEKGKGKHKAVSLGSKVTVDINGKKHVFTVVGEWEADPVNKKISHSSPLGKALLGKKVGDKVEVEAPAGKITYKIVKID
jgi:transcription elongation factor GreA